MRLLTMSIIIVLLAACSDDTTTPAVDATPAVDQAVADIGTVADTGVTPDTDVTPDTGVASDQGATPDKGVTPDQGATTDSSPATDAAPGCAPQDAKGQGACDMALGIKWDGKTCVGVSGCSCVGTDCKQLFSVGGLAACYKAYSKCIPCKPMDVTGQGACMAIIGYGWTGSACKAYSGCSCAGTDCAWIFKSQSACQAAFAHCP